MGRFGFKFECSLKVNDITTTAVARNKKDAKMECYKAMVLQLAAPMKPQFKAPTTISTGTATATLQVKQESSKEHPQKEQVTTKPPPAVLPPTFGVIALQEKKLAETKTQPVPNVATDSSSATTEPAAIIPPPQPTVAKTPPWFYPPEALKATSNALFGHPISLLMERQVRVQT